MVTKVLLAEDHGIIRAGVKALLDGEPTIEITCEAGDGNEVLTSLASHKVDLVLLDLNLPKLNGLECTRIIKKQFAGVKVLVLSMFDQESHLIELIDAGVDGYLLNNSKKDELLFAIKKISDGGIYIGPEFTLNYLTRKRLEASLNNGQDGQQKKAVPVSEKEMEVLELIAQGMTNLEMANKLFISVRTIETRRKKLLEKTGTTNTATLIRFAVLNGMIR